MLDYQEEEDRKKLVELERKNKRDREISDIKKLIEIPEARRFIWRLLTESRIHASCFNIDATVMAYSEGRRDIGLFILQEITEANKNAFSKIQNEYFSENGKVKKGK